MIKIVTVEYLGNKIMRLRFSDSTWGDFDLQPLIDRDTELVSPLRDDRFLAEYFLELGALCWKNGLELSPWSIHQKLKEQGRLQIGVEAA